MFLFFQNSAAQEIGQSEHDFVASCSAIFVFREKLYNMVLDILTLDHNVCNEHSHRSIHCQTFSFPHILFYANILYTIKSKHVRMRKGKSVKFSQRPYVCNKNYAPIYSRFSSLIFMKPEHIRLWTKTNMMVTRSSMYCHTLRYQPASWNDISERTLTLEVILYWPDSFSNFFGLPLSSMWPEFLVSEDLYSHLGELKPIDSIVSNRFFSIAVFYWYAQGHFPARLHARPFFNRKWDVQSLFIYAALQFCVIKSGRT